MKQRKILRQARKGFTLIELMIVIAIIGVLAAIAVPNFRAARQRANQRACYANQKTLAGAIEMYNLDFNANLGGSSGNVDAHKAVLVTNGYLQTFPSDPGGGAAATGTYQFDGASGNGITCTNAEHGSISPTAAP